ncbi:hypothetical protein PENTCL1PPCAC_15206, partial [Pristionchus entomophagus]
MSWVFLYIPDFIIVPSFSYFLIVLALTKDGSLRTPFFRFFIATGICGVSTVITHILMNRVIWPANIWWIQTILLVINQSGQLAASVGKFYIALHRYFVLRAVAVNESIWHATLVRVLLAIQFILPLVLTGSFFSFGYVIQTTVNDSISFQIAAQGLVVQKIVNNSVMIGYSIFAVVITHLSSRKLTALRAKLEGTSRRAVLKQQRNMFIIVAVCCLSHILKAAQQSLVIIFSLNGTIDRSLYETLLWPTFVATNGIATYAPALILVLRSRRIRTLIYG